MDSKVPGQTYLNILAQQADLLLAMGVIFVLAVMIIPLPPMVLDLFLALSFAFALIIILVTMYVTAPLQFSVFPGVLLLVTVFRLSLNVASTRLILGEAYAGKVIQAFGTFVVKGNYVVGFVIFLILVLINFIVITRGAARIAEVAARFTLDAMPGKQMSIDADLNAGIITEKEAQTRREEIGKEADFYGAMDGASKFIRGDAIAGLLITLVNIVGGFVIGILQLKMSFGQSIQTYTMLTVGDGLVTQIPALMVSTAAGIIVTRTTSQSILSQDVIKQVMARSRVIYTASAILLFFGLVPGLPTLPFFTLAILCGVVAHVALLAERAEQKQEVEKKAESAKRHQEEPIDDYLQVDPLELEIGYGLIPLVDAERGGDLMNRITMIRKQCALEMGFVVPLVRIRDNVNLDREEYVVRIRGSEVVRGRLMMGHWLTIDPTGTSPPVEGIQTTEPTFGLPAMWVTAAQKEQAELAGYTVIDPSTVITTHLMETVKSHAHELLSRQDVQGLIDNVRNNNAAVVEELIPGLLSIGSVHKVLRNLLQEKVPIRDVVTVLEVLADHAPYTKDTEVLTEYARHALCRTITSQYQEEDGKIAAMTLDPRVENMILESCQKAREQGSGLDVSPHVVQGLYSDLMAKMEKMAAEGHRPIILCSPMIRSDFKKIVEPTVPGLAVLSYSDLIPNVNVESVGVVTLKEADESST